MAKFETDERALRDKYLANFSEVLVQLGDLLAEKIEYITEVFSEETSNLFAALLFEKLAYTKFFTTNFV